MEGIVEYFGFWLLYLLVATLAFWCWQKLFFWMRPDGDLRRFFYMLGAVLVFTPAPIEAGSIYFAPAFVVVPFTILTSSLNQAMYAVNWLLVALVVGTLLLALTQLITRFSSVQKRSE